MWAFGRPHVVMWELVSQLWTYLLTIYQSNQSRSGSFKYWTIWKVEFSSHRHSCIWVKIFLPNFWGLCPGWVLVRHVHIYALADHMNKIIPSLEYAWDIIAGQIKHEYEMRQICLSLQCTDQPQPHLNEKQKTFHVNILQSLVDTKPWYWPWYTATGCNGSTQHDTGPIDTLRPAAMGPHIYGPYIDTLPPANTRPHIRDTGPNTLPPAAMGPHIAMIPARLQCHLQQWATQPWYLPGTQPGYTATRASIMG